MFCIFNYIDDVMLFHIGAPLHWSFSVDKIRRKGGILLNPNFTRCVFSKLRIRANYIQFFKLNVMCTNIIDLNSSCILSESN